MGHANIAELLPRPPFFVSELSHRLNGADVLVPGPLPEQATAVWRDVGKANEDGVHIVLNVGSLSSADWSALLDLARRDLAGVQVATTVDVTASSPT